MHRTLGLTAALVLVSGAAFPCGGPASLRLTDPIEPIPALANAVLYPTDGWDWVPRPEITLLYGLHAADASRFAAVDSLVRQRAILPADTTGADGAVVSMAAFDAALAANNVDAAVTAALEIVQTLLNTPAPLASSGAGDLRRAVELLELADDARRARTQRLRAFIDSASAGPRSLTAATRPAWLAAYSASPRVPSVAARALADRMAARLPSGWASDIQSGMTPAAWDSLEVAHTAWLQRYPSHPLAPFVRLKQMRLAYLRGDGATAWRRLVTLYAVAPVRVAYDMRHLLLNGVHPPVGILNDASVPVELRAALVGNELPTPDEWARLWRESEVAPVTAWRANLQERLLASLAADSIWDRAPLPSPLPAWRPDASPLWHRLWTLAQLRAGRPDDALRFRESPAADSTDGAALVARAHLQRRAWQDAIRTPRLEPDAARYLLMVLAPDSALAPLRAAVGPWQRLAAATLAARAAADGRWLIGADLLATTDSARAARYRTAAGLAAVTTPAGRLASARWLVQQRGRLMPQHQDPVLWYRSASWRWASLDPQWSARPSGEVLAETLPWSRAEERERIGRHFRTTSEDYLALQAYAAWFAAMPSDAPARAASVREANAAYRRLVDFGRVEGLYWAGTLPDAPEASAIRAAGRRTGGGAR